MANLNIQKKAIDAITVMNVAITNIRLYPPVSNIVLNTVDRVYNLLIDILRHEKSVMLGESGKNIIICGQIFAEKDQARYPQALAFIELLMLFGIKTISFEKNLDKSELKNFLQVISKRPEEIEQEGGFQEVIALENIPNIIIDHKVYVVLDKDKQLLTDFDVSDEEIIQFIAGNHSFGKQEIEKIKQAPKSFEWAQQVFSAAVSNMLTNKNSKTREELEAGLADILKTLDNISNKEDKEEVAKGIALSAAEMDNEQIALIIAHNTEEPFAEILFKQLTDKLPDEKFEKIAEIVVSSESAPDDNIIKRIALEKNNRKKQRARLNAEIKEILAGNYNALREDLLILPLQNYLEQLINSNKEKTAETIISSLSDALMGNDPEIQDRAYSILLNTSKYAVKTNSTESITTLINQWIKWIRAEDSLTQKYLQIISLIKDVIHNFVKKSQFAQCTPILETFNMIYYAKLGKSLPIRELAGEMLKEVATKEILDILLKECLTNAENKRQFATDNLILFGEISIDPMLDMLQESRDMSERAHILQTVSEIEQSPNILANKIREGGPWYYLRNLILMLGKAGKEKHLSVLTPLLKHEDFRVQRETLNSIYNIGGAKRGKIILSSLKNADERMKNNIVDMLGALQYEKAVPDLIEMLESKSLFSSKTGDKLKEKICMALGNIGSEQAISKLTSISTQKGLLGLKVFPENIKEAAENALIKYRNNQVRLHKEKAETLTVVEPVPQSEPGLEPKLDSDPDSIPETKSKTIGRNDDTLEETVVTLLFESIVKKAKEKNFEEAERLRNQLIEIDDMALDEIIKSGEIIEAEKNESTGIEQDHLGIWPELYDTLTPEEANALFDAMEEKEFETDQIVFKQGLQNDKLWFIRQGQLKLVFTRGERENLLKTIDPGDIAGQDTFFSISVCTTSLITLSPVKISFLNKKMLNLWNSEFPALESKLHDYCLSLDRVHDILKGKGMDRRTQKRIDFTGTVMVGLLSSSGAAPVKNFKGSMADVSIGGMSFIIKTPNRKNVSMLLGRKLKLEFYFPPLLWEELNSGVMLSANIMKKSKAVINPIGMVIGVSHQLDNDYSIHIRFDKLLYDVFAEKYDNKTL